MVLEPQAASNATDAHVATKAVRRIQFAAILCSPVGGIKGLGNEFNEAVLGRCPLQPIAYTFPIGGVGRGFDPDELGTGIVEIA